MNSYLFKKKKGNFPLFFVVFFFVGGYLFFFSSNYWMPANLSAKLQTELRENITWGERTLQIRRWDYCEADEVMEVELDVANNSYDGKNHYIYTAVSRSNNNLTVETMIEDSDWIVLRIAGVNKDFGEVSLRLDKDKKETDTLRLYTNVNVVNRVQSLTKRDRTGYMVLRMETDKVAYEKENTSLEKQIRELSEKNARMQEEIEHLHSKTSYQTEEQKQETDDRIKEIQLSMTENQDSILSLTEKIEENKKRIALLEKQI